MNVSHFIARRIVQTNDEGFTKIIIKIAIVAIALSMSVMLITSSMISGFKNEITSKIIGFWGHIHITDGGINNTLERMNPIQADAPYLQDLLNTEQVNYQAPYSFLGMQFEGKYISAQTKGGISHVQQFTFEPGIISTKTQFGGVILKGVGKDYDWSRLQPYLIEGEPIDLNDEKDNEIILSSTIARSLKIKLGQRIRVSFIKEQDQVKRVFVVNGIYNTGLEEFDKQFAIVDVDKLRGIKNWTDNQVGGYEVFLDDIDDLETMSEYIYYEVLPPNLLAQSIKTRLNGIFEWLKLQDINMQVILILMIIVAIINMMTALLILILDRSKMIGVLKALGTSNWTVRKIFIYQAAYIILFGMSIGNILGLGLFYIQKTTGFIQLDEANYYLTQAPIDFDILSILLINVGTFVITLLFLIVPTMIISWISPVKVLTFD